MPKISLEELKKLLSKYNHNGSQYRSPIISGRSALCYMSHAGSPTPKVFDYPKLNLSAMLGSYGYDLDLSGYNFSGIDCTDINFGKVNLTGCDFTGVNSLFALIDVNNEFCKAGKVKQAPNNSGGTEVIPLPKGSPVSADAEKTPNLVVNLSLQSDRSSSQSAISKYSTGKSVSRSSSDIGIMRYMQPIKASVNVVEATQSIVIDRNMPSSSQNMRQMLQSGKKASQPIKKKRSSRNSSQPIKQNCNDDAKGGLLKFFSKPSSMLAAMPKLPEAIDLTSADDSVIAKSASSSLQVSSGSGIDILSYSHSVSSPDSIIRETPPKANYRGPELQNMDSKQGQHAKALKRAREDNVDLDKDSALHTIDTINSILVTPEKFANSTQQISQSPRWLFPDSESLPEDEDLFLLSDDDVDAVPMPLVDYTSPLELSNVGNSGGEEDYGISAISVATIASLPINIDDEEDFVDIYQSSVLRMADGINQNLRAPEECVNSTQQIMQSLGWQLSDVGCLSEARKFSFSLDDDNLATSSKSNIPYVPLSMANHAYSLALANSSTGDGAEGYSSR